jgi:GR25 family glycosyltransferase involved in LPS biosynthesis
MAESIDLLTDGIIPTMYYINLDNAEDRRNHFLSQATKFNASFKLTRVPAVNGMSHHFTQEELVMFENYKQLWFYPYDITRKKIMGNQLSHYYTLIDVLKNNYPYAVIVQDDVVFKDDFVTHINRVLKCVPSDAEIINLGYHKEACGAHFVPLDLNDPETENAHVKGLVTDRVCIMGGGINPCSLAYIVTLKGAKNLVEHFNANGFQKESDHNFNEYLMSKNIFYASSPILCTGNHHFPSSIFL